MRVRWATHRMQTAHVRSATDKRRVSPAKPGFRNRGRVRRRRIGDGRKESKPTLKWERRELEAFHCDRKGENTKAGVIFCPKIGAI